MKKTLAFVLVCVMAITSLVGCGSNAEKAEVTLLGVTMKEHPAGIAADTVSVPRLLAAPETVGEAPAAGTDAAGTDAAPNDDEFISYIVIYRTQELVDLTIHLDNPKDYYIFDFTLSSSDESVEIEINGKFKPLKDCKSIRWNSDDNETCTYTLRLPDTEKTSPTDIRIGAMYYSDREDGSNRLHVNMNDRENYDIYRTDERIDKSSFLRRQNNIDFFEFDLEKMDDGTISVELNGEELAPTAETETAVTYRLASEGDLKVTYTSEAEPGVVYHITYEENIQFLKFVCSFSSEPVSLIDHIAIDNCIYIRLNYSITGTDFVNLKEDDIRTNIGPVHEFHFDSAYIVFAIYPYPGFSFNSENVTFLICGSEFSLRFFEELPAPQQ